MIRFALAAIFVALPACPAPGPVDPVEPKPTPVDPTPVDPTATPCEAACARRDALHCPPLPQDCVITCELHTVDTAPAMAWRPDCMRAASSCEAWSLCRGEP